MQWDIRICPLGACRSPRFNIYESNKITLFNICSNEVGACLPSIINENDPLVKPFIVFMFNWNHRPQKCVAFCWWGCCFASINTKFHMSTLTVIFIWFKHEKTINILLSITLLIHKFDWNFIITWQWWDKLGQWSNFNIPCPLSNMFSSIFKQLI